LLRGSLLEGAQAVGTAKDRRLRFLRGTVLFAALAIEAFANELLAELLSPRDFDAVDRLEVPDKLLIGTRLASGHSPLSRGAQPLQDVATVVKTRNRLVHAKPQNGIAAWIRDVEAADEEAVGPGAALRAILRVAETVAVCTELREYPNLHGGVAKTILNHRQMLVRHNSHAGPKIADVPAKDAEGVPPLWNAMQEAIAPSAGLRGSDRETGPAAGEPSPGEPAVEGNESPPADGDARS
jgi:hypothetical protein